MFRHLRALGAPVAVYLNIYFFKSILFEAQWLKVGIGRNYRASLHRRRISIQGQGNMCINTQATFLQSDDTMFDPMGSASHCDTLVKNEKSLQVLQNTNFLSRREASPFEDTGYLKKPSRESVIVQLPGYMEANNSKTGKNEIMALRTETLCLTPPPEHMSIASDENEANQMKALALTNYSKLFTQSAVVTPTMGKQLNLQHLQIPVRAPLDGEVVVKIAWTGLCGSDACFSVGPEPGFPQHDHIAGHEGIGQIVQSHNPILLGRPVAARYLASTCQSCDYCLRGTLESCPDQKNFPKHYNGTFQQYMTVPWTSLMPLPDWVFNPPPEISPAAFTAALCSGSTALKALRAAIIKPNDVVVVVGIAGAVGHLAGLMAKKVFQARVIGVDWAWKADLALIKGGDVCDTFVPAPTTADENSCMTFEERLSKECAALRPSGTVLDRGDAVLVAGSSIAAFDRLPEYVVDGGSIICIGVPRGGGMLSLPLATVVERQLKIQGTMMGGHEEVLKVMQYICAGKIKPYITEIGPKDIPTYMDKFPAHQSFGKTVVRIEGPVKSTGV